MSADQHSKEYDNARKKGVKAKNVNLSQGLDPHVPSLDGIIANESIISEVSLGGKDLILKKIVGTLNHSRAVSFGPNFMPLMGNYSEFAFKWKLLYDAQLTEGIRDPIKVYEYLNRYYVVEGNKRVSVMKHLDAYSIQGTVTRLLPKYDPNNKPIVIYYAFLNFYNKTNIDFIWFSEAENFESLYKWVKKYNWCLKEDGTDLKLFYMDFRDVYHNLGGDKIRITTGDAFLEYLEIYTYSPQYSKSTLKSQLKRMWSEFSLLTNDENFEIETTSEQLEIRKILPSFSSITSSNKKQKIAFLHSKSPKESRWTFEHEKGRKYVEFILNDSIETIAINHVSEDESAYEVLKDLAEQDYDILFTTAPTFIKPTLKAALEYTNTKFLNCSENMSYKNIRTYFGRIYEPNFLVGMIAGSLTKTDSLGYVATYPVPEVINCINAFTLGARFVNPSATVHIKWVHADNGDSLEQANLIDQQFLGFGIDIVIHEESADHDSFKNFQGIYYINENGIETAETIATPKWNWGNFYLKLLNNIISGNYQKVSTVLSLNDRAINYWWGMKEKVVDVSYDPDALPVELVKTVEFMKQMIISNEYQIFKGPIYNNKQELVVEKGKELAPLDILQTDWFVNGVLGSIPTIAKDKESHPLLEMINVNKR